jgi:hypothetical protein
VAFCKHGHERSGYMKGENFLTVEQILASEEGISLFFV